MSQDIHAHRILILDFGSQYTQLIARRVREIGVYCEIHPFDMSNEAIIAFAPRGIILAGGPESVHEADSPRAPQAVFDLKVPLFGICYGMQTMAEQMGGKVQGSDLREFGYARVDVVGKARLLDGIEDHVDDDGVLGLDVWMSHGDKVTEMPAGFHIPASTPSCPIAAMADDARAYYGVQFHPEVTHTKQGLRILSRFVLDICGCAALWTLEHRRRRHRHRARPGRFLQGPARPLRRRGLLGGRRAAAQGHRRPTDLRVRRQRPAAPARRRPGDGHVRREHGREGDRANAEDKFLGRLAGVADPEEKRKIIGRTFIEVFDEEATKLQDVKFLAQGTIYPDVIESAGAKTGKAHVIKSHHNVGGLPEDMQFELVERCANCSGRSAQDRPGAGPALRHGLPPPVPRPGPGRAHPRRGEEGVRRPLRQADHIFIEELRAFDWYHKTSQAFVVFQPVKSVGVVGDGRRYAWVVALRAVETIDFMTARWAHLPYELLEKVSNRIINEIAGISRVTYDVSSKPPATIEWE